MLCERRVLVSSCHWVLELELLHLGAADVRQHGVLFVKCARDLYAYKMIIRLYLTVISFLEGFLLPFWPFNNSILLLKHVHLAQINLPLDLAVNRARLGRVNSMLNDLPRQVLLLVQD